MCQEASKTEKQSKKKTMEYKSTQRRKEKCAAEAAPRDDSECEANTWHRNGSYRAMGSLNTKRKCVEVQ